MCRDRVVAIAEQADPDEYFAAYRAVASAMKDLAVANGDPEMADVMAAAEQQLRGPSYTDVPAIAAEVRSLGFSVCGWY